MTLEQAFPGLRDVPGGAIVAAAGNLFDVAGPAFEAQMALAENWTRDITGQIKAVDPTWRYDRLAPATTIEEKIHELNDLRFQRAVVFLRVKGDAGPLQVETTRFLQQQTDLAYDAGLALLEAGQLMPRLSERGLGQLYRRASSPSCSQALQCSWHRFGREGACPSEPSGERHVGHGSHLALAGRTG
jgi:hypothetical protein